MSFKARAESLHLDISHFKGRGWNRGTGMGRNDAAAQAAKRRWYEKNRDVYRERNAKRRRERTALIAATKARPCADCGVQYPFFAMEFDHREGELKAFSISNASNGLSMARLMEEIAKCDVVCCLCHRFRTARRAGWRGLDAATATPELDNLVDDE
ncbi:hypothetical protein ACSNN7_11640 [Micromonospora sp. URMC 105]|uniref:hypothetical protein n=1 Tax=Micromonospora sp. URMC 105 TaxID=3423413 RepID=UPI003F1B07DD